MAKNLRDDKEHANQCHTRWMRRRNRKQEELDYAENWYSEQCGGCIYFIPLMGILSDDYGVCSNPESDFDGIVRFEHDGCGQYAQAEDWI